METRFDTVNLRRELNQQIKSHRKKIAEMLASLVEEKVISSTSTVAQVIEILER